jgi:hypothetical protein
MVLYVQFALLAAHLLLVVCLNCSSTLKMDLIHSSETLVDSHSPTQHYYPDDSIPVMKHFMFNMAVDMTTMDISETLETYIV